MNRASVAIKTILLVAICLLSIAPPVHSENLKALRADEIYSLLLDKWILMVGTDNLDKFLDIQGFSPVVDPYDQIEYQLMVSRNDGLVLLRHNKDIRFLLVKYVPHSPPKISDIVLREIHSEGELDFSIDDPSSYVVTVFSSSTDEYFHEKKYRISVEGRLLETISEMHVNKERHKEK